MNKDFFNLPDLPFYEDNYALRVYQILVINRELLELTGLIPPQKLLPKYCTSTEETIYQCARWVNPSNPDDGLDYAYQLIGLYVDKKCSLEVIADLIVDTEYPSTKVSYRDNGLAWNTFLFWGSERSDKLAKITKFLENNLIPQNDTLNRFKWYRYAPSFTEWGSSWEAINKTLKDVLDNFDYKKFMEEYLKNKGDKENE